METTSLCNLDCGTCLKPAYENVWLERKMDERLFSLIHTQLPDKSSVHLQGWGEPLLHPDTLSHVRQLKAAGATVSFTTNGTIMDKALAESLICSGLDGLTFSMAGNSHSSQDTLRGVGSFSLLQRAIRTFIAAKNRHGTFLPRLAVSYLLTPKTVYELPGAVSWCRKNGVDAFVAVHLTQAGCRNQQNLQFMMSKHESRHYNLLRIQTQLRAFFSALLLKVCHKKQEIWRVC